MGFFDSLWKKTKKETKKVASKTKKPIVSDHIAVQTSLYAYPKLFFEEAYSLCQFQGSRISDEIDILLEELYEGMELPHAPFKIKIDNGL